jgi:energy-coupling factor transporter ATP-binding protein EcfA2
MIMNQVTTVNWGQLPIGDVQLAEVVLLGGETGAGKSSFIDAVIGVMTGNELRFAKYNSAQSETSSSKKTKRTIASYVLGADDSAEPHRQHGAHGYAGLYFEPDEKDDGAGQPFTAIVGTEARLEKLANQPVFKSLEDVRIIVFGAKIGAADLIRIVDRTEEVIPVNELLVALRKKFGRDSVRDYSTKTEYVCRLYATLKGQSSPVDRREAEGCMRAFVNSIAYRQPDDIDALIREDILEPDDNARMIETLKTTITDVSNLRQQAERMENNVRLLEEANGFLTEGAKHFIEEWMFAALEAARLLQDAVNRRNEALDAKERATAALGEINKEIVDCDAQAAFHNDAWERLKTRINDSDVHRIRLGIQDRIARSGDTIRSFEQKLRSATLTLSAARNVIRQSISACSGIDDLRDAAIRLSAVGEKIDGIHLPEIEGHFRAVKDGLDGGAAASLQEAIVAIDAAVGSGWTTEIDSVAETFLFAHDKLRQHLDLLRMKRSDSETKRQALASGRTNYPRGVSEFVAHLARVLPEAKPRILCDVVEMKDPSWQNAVEGFIGGDKAAISDLPVSIPGRSAAEVFNRLTSIRALYDHRETLYLRELSSRTFWGLSKVLDNRSDLVAALLGLADCPYPAQPVHLNVYFGGPFSWILFVENKTSFERAIRDARETLLHGRFSPYAGAALVYSSGFMGTAGRIRKSSGCRTFYSLDAVSNANEIEAFDAAFYSDIDVNAAFWGDLDHAGMAILSSLRTTFPSARAWEPGYAPMLVRLDAGEGHVPEEAKKAGQKPILSTGCSYADSVLIPSLVKHGRFIDQE